MPAAADEFAQQRPFYSCFKDYGACRLPSVSLTEPKTYGETNAQYSLFSCTEKILLLYSYEPLN